MIIWSIVAIILLIAADQITKELVVMFLKPDGKVTVIEDLLQFVYVENRGAAFGFLQNQRWFFVVITLIATIALLYILFFYKKHNFFSKLACVLIIAGGIGNLIDRIKLSYVVDFISVSFFPPVFNFADCCVVVGAISVVVYMLTIDRKSKKLEEREKENEQEDTDTCSGE